MSTEKDVVEIVAIIDRSGSMESIRGDVIGGYNAFLAQQKALPGEAVLTLVQFDDKYEVHVDRVPVQEVPDLNVFTFVPRGMTAANDAIGRALNTLEARNPAKAVILIVTDGMENASKEFTNEQIKEKITAAEERGWDVNFLAANIDAFAAGGAYGVKMDKTFAFAANAAGVHNAFATMNLRASSYRSV